LKAEFLILVVLEDKRQDIIVCYIMNETSVNTRISSIFNEKCI
jgi:hypothetical protein